MGAGVQREAGGRDACGRRPAKRWGIRRRTYLRIAKAGHDEEGQQAQLHDWGVGWVLDVEAADEEEVKRRVSLLPALICGRRKKQKGNSR